MPWEKVVALLYLLKKQKFRKSHYMFKENQHSEGFYIVKNGEIFVRLFYFIVEYLS
jgi:CRP-like cAMP-binding protein